MAYQTCQLTTEEERLYAVFSSYASFLAGRGRQTPFARLETKTLELMVAGCVEDLDSLPCRERVYYVLAVEELELRSLRPELVRCLPEPPFLSDELAVA